MKSEKTTSIIENSDRGNNVIIYPAIIQKYTQNNTFIVVFPDIKNCISAGNTMEEAIINAQEALAIHYHHKKGCLPPPSDISQIKLETDDCIVQLICVNTDTYALTPPINYKSVRKTLTIPQWLDDIACNHNINFSQTLQNALVKELKKMEDLEDYERLLLNKNIRY